MRSPIIQAKQSLVLNGDFRKGMKEWKRIGNYSAIQTPFFEGQVTPVLALGRKSGVSQSFRIPVTPGDVAQYSLTFLWETLHTRSGWLRIFNDQTMLHEYELRSPASAHPPQETVLEAGVLDEFVPQSGRLELGTSFVADDTLRIEIVSPENDAGDEYSKIRITHVDLQVKLEPLQLQALNADWETFNPDSDFVLHLCLGASASFAHQLKFVPRDDNAWAGSAASLAVIDNPDGAIVVAPGLDEDQSLAQTWTIDCPLMGGELYPLSLNLRSQYDADSYPIAVSLGHHRLAFIDTHEADYYPVLGQSVRLGVKIGSYYTGQFLDGRTVNWAVKGQGVKSATVTNEQGWAWFDYPTDTSGEVVVEASVCSPYYASGSITHLFAFNVLASDPWDELLAIVDGETVPWTSTDYPNRGSAHTVQISWPGAEVLMGSTLALHWSGDAQDQLGVSVSPELELPVLFEGNDLTWTLNSADRLDGRFCLSLVCSKLLEPSPKRPMLLARNQLEIGDVREATNTPVVADNEAVLLRMQVVHTTDRGPGEGVIDAAVEWVTRDGNFSTHTGSGGWTSLLYPPEYIGEQIVTASVTGYPGAATHTCNFEVKSIASSSWKDKIEITFDGGWSSPPHRGMICKRGESSTLRVKALPDSPLIGRYLTLDWRKTDPDIGLNVSEIGVPKLLGGEGEVLSWELSSDIETSISSLFDLKLTTEGLEDKELFGRLMMPDINDEMSVLLDQTTAGRAGTLYPCLGGRHRYIFRPHALSPLVGLNLDLQWSGTSPEQLGITVEPALNDEQILGDGGVSWTLDCSLSRTSGYFELNFLTHSGAIARTPMRLDHNKLGIVATRESPVYPVVGQEPAWMWAQVISAITGAPVDRVPVQWIVDGQSHGTPTADAGWSGYPFKPVKAGPQAIECRVKSPYDGHEDSRVMIVRALDKDPWDALTIDFDGAKRLWGQTLFPRRKGQYVINVAAGDDSPLYGHDLMLGMTAPEPAGLSVQFTGYALGVPRTFSSAGLNYFFTVGDGFDGTFDLCLASERLASLSPANAMSVGAGDELGKFAERPRVKQTLPWGTEVVEEVTVVSTATGKPMSGITVTWRSPELGLASSVTNFHGVASIGFVPVIAGAFELTASLGNEQNPASMVLAYVLDEPREIKALISDDPSGYPGQQFCANATVVSALTGEPLPDVWVSWEFEDVMITPSQTNADGVAVVSFELPFIREGVLEAVVQGGIAGWAVKSLGVVIDVPELKQLTVPGGNVVHVGELTLVYGRVMSSATQRPIEGIEVVWVKDNIEQARRTTTNVRGEVHENFTALASGTMTIEAQIRDPQGKSFDSQEFVFTVVERS